MRRRQAQSGLAPTRSEVTNRWKCSIVDNMKKKFILLLLFFFSFVAVGLCKDLRFDISLDDASISVGESTQLKLVFNGKSVPPLDIPKREGLNIEYRGPSTVMSFVNGKMSKTITHIYSLIPLKEGSFRIGPFRFSYKGNNYSSNSVVLNVSSGKYPANVNSSAPPSGSRLNEYVFLELEIPRNEIYVNEEFPVTVKLYASRFSLQDIQYPELESNGVTFEPFSKPKQYRQFLKGMRYEVIEFKTKGVAIKPGRFDIGPATLPATLVVKSRRRRGGVFGDDFFGDDFFDNFFGNYDLKKIMLSSNKVSVNVLPLPEKGMPKQFDGAVGSFDMQVSVSPRSVKVGDPITIEAVVSGYGNLNMVKAPKLVSTDGFKIYDPQAEIKGNRKIFEQVILPVKPGIESVPPVVFSYFDVNSGKYKVIKKGPFNITVEKSGGGTLKIVSSADNENKNVVYDEVLGRDIAFIKEVSNLKPVKKPLVFSKIYWAVNIVMVFLFIAANVILSYNRRIRSDIRYARKKMAFPKARKHYAELKRILKKGDTASFYDKAFFLVREVLGDLFHLPSRGMTIDVVKRLRDNGKISGGLYKKIERIFEECDMARFAPSSDLNIKEAFKVVSDILSELNKVKR